jgi:hypothetical protein
MRVNVALASTVGGLVLIGSLAVRLGVSQPTSEAPSATGMCLEGYAYVSSGTTTVGSSQPVCLLRTDCTSSITAGPARESFEGVEAGHYVGVPIPGGVDVTCYV